MSCIRCNRKVKRPLSLICDHVICYPCGSLILELDTLNERQKRYKLKCTKCKKLTYTYDLDNLILDEDQSVTKNQQLESFEEFATTNVTSRQQYLSHFNTRKFSNPLEGQCPTVTLCDQEEAEPIKTPLPTKINKGKTLQRIINSKKKLQLQYNMISQKITDQFYELNRTITKHRQHLLAELDSMYSRQIQSLNAYSVSLSQKQSLNNSSCFIKIQEALQCFQSNSIRLRRTKQQVMDCFLKRQIYLQDISDGEQITFRKKDQREEGYQQWRMSVPLRSRQNQMHSVFNRNVKLKQRQKIREWKG